MRRRPATASADSRRSDAESVLSASQHKPRPFVTAVKSQPACDKVSDWLSKDSYGQVPNYLVERQLEMAAQLAEEEVCTTATLTHSYHMCEKDGVMRCPGTSDSADARTEEHGICSMPDGRMHHLLLRRAEYSTRSTFPTTDEGQDWRRLSETQQVFQRACVCFQRKSGCRRSVSLHRAGRILRQSCR